MPFAPGIDNSPMWQRADYSQMNRLGDMLDKRREENKRESAQASAADKFLNALPEDQRPPGLDPHSLKMMGGKDKIAHMQGLIGAQSYQKGQEDLKLDLARRLSLADSLQAAQEQRANTARFPDFARSLTDATAPSVGQMQDFYEGPPGLGNAGMPDESQRPQSRPITPRDFFQSLQSSGYNPGNETDSLLRSIEAGNERGTGVDWENVKPREGKTSSGRGYVYGKGGQFQFEPDMTNGGQDHERTLSDGTLQSWNGRQWVTVPRERADPGKVTDRDKYNAIQRQIAAIAPFAASDPKMAARLKELETELGGLGQGGPAAPDADIIGNDFDNYIIEKLKKR